MVKGVIFDFDGLIIDTETAWYEAYKDTLKSYDIDLPLNEFAKCIGTHDTVLFDYFRSQLGESCDIEEIEERARELHKIKMAQVQAREGVKEYLEEARSSGMKIALASSSTREWVTYFLGKLDLLHYFEAIVTRDDVEKVKPAPDLYVKAMARLGIEPAEALAFEDSLNGLNAAVAAGLKCVIVPNPVTEALLFENYHFRLKSMAERSLGEVVSVVSGKG